MSNLLSVTQREERETHTCSFLINFIDNLCTQYKTTHRGRDWFPQNAASLCFSLHKLSTTRCLVSTLNQGLIHRGMFPRGRYVHTGQNRRWFTGEEKLLTLLGLCAPDTGSPYRPTRTPSLRPPHTASPQFLTILPQYSTTI